MIRALTPPPVLAAAWFRRGTLDVNQVIGDTTAVRLNVMGEKTHDAGRDQSQK
ncbi:catecholate siderophore TonB-dependent receptor [Escherichia coli]|uniref:Catecholate siderophore TonB-dependent receptor n=1 Tax=Escherichia coli TaxID=562 RepID=A0A3S4K6P6_ECOLX|nr:catecholate siderophore TonB-dependent receptor [Escherichia coli]